MLNPTGQPRIVHLDPLTHGGCPGQVDPGEPDRCTAVVKAAGMRVR